MTTVRLGMKQASKGKQPVRQKKKKKQPDKKPWGRDEGRPIVTTLGRPPKPVGRMALWVVGAKSNLLLPYAPRDVTYTLGGRQWTEVARDGGRTPLLLNSGTGLKKIQFTTFVGHQDWERPVMHVLNALERIYKNRKPVVIQWSSYEDGHWRITNLTVNSTMRAPDSNDITRATVDIEFTQASDARKNMGPASGGKGGDDKDDDKLEDGKGGDKRPKQYKVKKGDTLIKIAMKFYGNAKAWHKIAKANKIKRPRHELKPGRVLKLP